MLKNSTAYIFLIFFLIGVSPFTRAQVLDSVRVDTLVWILTSEAENDKKIEAYLELEDEYARVSEYEVSLTYAKLAKDLAKETEDIDAEFEATLAIAHKYLAYYLDYEASLREYDAALELADVLDSDEKRIAVYRGYSSLYSTVKQYDQAIHFIEMAIEIAEDLGDNKLVSDLNAYGGNIYEEKGDSSEAMLMYEEVLRIEEESNYKNTSKAAYTIIGHYYHLKGDFEESLRRYRIALKRFERLEDSRWVSYTHAEISRVYADDDNFTRAEQHALKGLQIAEEFDLHKERGDNLLVLANLYKQIGQIEKSNSYQKEYDLLMDSVYVELDEKEVDSTEPTSSNEVIESNSFSNILSAIIILLIVVVAVFISGIIAGKSNS